MLLSGIPNFAPIEVDDEAVAVLPLYPGVSLRRAWALLADDTLKGLVLYSYGIGNPPSYEGELLSALTATNERGAALLNVTLCAQGAYATGAALNKTGVIAGGDITLEAAIAKLTVLLGRCVSSSELRKALTSDLRGEVSPFPIFY